jgi:hypothetical protein
MEQWLQRVKKSIIPLSIEKKDIRKALAEWFYTGENYDLECPSEDCELCGHTNIRYQFTIQNRKTSKELLIGSECITRFEIPAVDDSGKILSPKETEKVVSKGRRKLITDAKERRMIQALLELKKKEERFDVDSFITYFKDRGAFTPKQLALLTWRLDENDVPWNPTDFKITIKRKREKKQLLGLENYQIQAILPCLSPPQKKFLIDNKSEDYTSPIKPQAKLKRLLALLDSTDINK